MKWIFIYVSMKTWELTLKCCFDVDVKCNDQNAKWQNLLSSKWSWQLEPQPCLWLLLGRRKGTTPSEDAVFKILFLFSNVPLKVACLQTIFLHISVGFSTLETKFCFWGFQSSNCYRVALLKKLQQTCARCEGTYKNLTSFNTVVFCKVRQSSRFGPAPAKSPPPPIP